MRMKARRRADTWMTVRALTYTLVAAICILSVLPAGDVLADVTVPGIFGDHMILQRDIPVPVWGTADVGEVVTVQLDDAAYTATADVFGKWRVNLPPTRAGGPHTLTISGTETISFSDVLFGEVWICSGQSNMQMSVKQLRDAEDRISDSELPRIRMISLNRVNDPLPLDDLPGNTPSWIPSSRDAVSSFSAVGFFFGRELHRELGVPIGLIHSSWGGTVAEAWTRREALYADARLRPILGWWDERVASFPEASQRYKSELATWQQAIDRGADAGPKPSAPRGLGSGNYPGGLFNAMIHPIIPYAIAGTIWYQGESNTQRAWQYKTLFRTMVDDWRNAWGQGDFPFLYVQLANWDKETIPTAFNENGSWPELREAQLETLELPNTSMAVAIDIGESEDIHPSNKWDVGHRLAAGAKRIVYDRSVVHSGPIYSSHYTDGLAIHLRFRHAADSLMTLPNVPLNGFEIAGNDREFLPAEARIRSGEVIVFNRGIPEPVAVRYGWDDDPLCTLYNSAGLPASPFRTDDWPMKTYGRVTP
jgi:sialate O-acetylesterase